MRARPTASLPSSARSPSGSPPSPGCAPTGAQSEQVTPEIVAVNPELATLPDIPVLEDLVYGGTRRAAAPAGRVLADHRRRRSRAERRAAPTRTTRNCRPHGSTGPGAARACRDRRRARRELDPVATRPTSRGAPSANGSHPPGTSPSRSTTAWHRPNVFPAAIEDVQAAVAWLRADEQIARFNIDPDRIGAFGGLAGGNLVALLGTLGSGDLTTASRVAAVAELSGPIDLTGLADDRRLRAGAARLPRMRDRGGLPGRAPPPRRFYAIDAQRPAVLRRPLDRREDPAPAGRAVRRRPAGGRGRDRVRHRRGRSALDRDARRRPQGAHHRLLRRDDRHAARPARAARRRRG